MIHSRVILRSTGRYDRSRSAKKEPPPVSNFLKLVVFLFVHWTSNNVCYSANLNDGKKMTKQDTTLNKGDSYSFHLSLFGRDLLTLNCTVGIATVTSSVLVFNIDFGLVTVFVLFLRLLRRKFLLTKDGFLNLIKLISGMVK